MSIGERLKQARKSKGMSQDLLAEKIGTSRGVITNIEHNKIEEPQPIILKAICEVLSISKDWLIHGIGSMELSRDSVRSAKVLSEIYTLSQELSEEEQLYILDMINTYKKHLNNAQ